MSALRKIITMLQRENLLSLLAIILSIVVISSLAITYFEPGLDLVNAVWWSIVTLTTVGYGDISPTTTGGRAVAVIIMFFGIGILGTLSANLATMMINKRFRENQGMQKTHLKNHLILCEWNHRSRAVLQELRGEPKTSETPVVLIADLESKPLEDPLLLFVRGTVNEETLAQANLKKARTVLIVGDDTLDPTARDAKAVLTTLTVESINPEAYTIVELVNKANETHCRRARADEIIIGSELSSHLLATAAIDHGMSAIVSELIKPGYGNDLYSEPVPETLAGTPYLDLLILLKKEHQATLLGIQKGRGGKLTTNPEAGYLIEADDFLVMIAGRRPALEA